MRTFITSLVVALILAGLFAAPVAAAAPDHWGYPPYPWPGHVDYGWQPPPPYYDPNIPWVTANTVQPAQAPPQYNYYYYPGQTWYQPTQTYTPTYYYPSWNYGYNPPVYSYTSSAAASVSSTWAREGDAVTVYASGFPANADVDFRIGMLGSGASLIYDAVTGADGRTSITFTMPVDADPGELWNAYVVTTESSPGYGKEAYTPNIYIGS